MKALVVVDYQNDFVDGALGFEEAKSLESVIVEKIKNVRTKGGRVIFTMDTHNKNYLDTQEGQKLPIAHCINDTPGHEIYGKVAQMMFEDDLIITKETFGSLELANLMAKMKFEEVELCGLVTDICVLANAVLVKAALPESRIVVDSKAVATANKEAGAAALTAMKSQQIDVL